MTKFPTVPPQLTSQLKRRGLDTRTRPSGSECHCHSPRECQTAPTNAGRVFRARGRGAVRGYDPAEVDDFLQRVDAVLATTAGDPRSAPGVGSPTGARERVFDTVFKLVTIRRRSVMRWMGSRTNWQTVNETRSFTNMLRSALGGTPGTAGPDTARPFEYRPRGERFRQPSPA